MKGSPGGTRLRVSWPAKASCGSNPGSSLAATAFERQRPLSQPLAFWLEEDILRYLKMTGIPYAPIYGDIVESRKKNGTPILKTTGVSRSGCMYCMYGVHLEHEPNRFQLMQVTHPQQYDYCINKLGCGAVLDYIGVPYRNQQLEVDHC